MRVPRVQRIDVIAGAASISQLVVYSFATIRSLQKLYAALTTGHSVYREEEKNIRLLLDVIKRLPTHQTIRDSDPVLHVLIDISGLACQVLHLLRPKQFLGYNWTALPAQDKIDSAFKALDKNRELLHLCVSQANNDPLNATRIALGHQGNRLSSGLPGNAMSQRASIVSNGNHISGYADVGNGFTAETMPNIHHSNNIVPAGGTEFKGNARQNSEATVKDIHARQVELAYRQPDTALHPIRPQTMTKGQTQAPSRGVTPNSSAGTGSVGGRFHSAPDPHRETYHIRQHSDPSDSTYGSHDGVPNERLDF